MSEITDFIAEVLSNSSEIAQSNFGKTQSCTVKPEDSNQVLTETDLAISKYLLQQISTAFPSHNIIDEEAGVIDNGSEFTWVLDPIDGTSNFAVSVPLYGCMIGLLKHDIPVAGGVVLPSFNEIYIAEKGSGAFCNGRKILANLSAQLKDALVAYGFDSHKDDPDLTYQEGVLASEIILHCRNLRSSNSVFDIMQVAQGHYGAYLNRTSKIWDQVAPQIIVEEAGGIYTDFDGNPMNYTNALERSTENFTCCLAAPSMHAEIQHLITVS